MYQISRRHVLQGLGAGFLAASTPSIFAANPTATFVVPFNPGGPIDTTARIISSTLPKVGFKNTVLIKNLAGANGATGANYVARAKPDGRTFLFGSIHHSILPSLAQNLPYNILKDFIPVGLAATYPIILVVNSRKISAQTVNQLVAESKKRVLTFGSSGTGGGTHLAGELFNVLAGTNLQHQPFKGSAPAMQDLIAGHIDLMFADGPSVIPHLAGGKIRALAIGDAKRSPILPQLPTLMESGIKDYQAYSWGGIFAPKNTPLDKVLEMNTYLNMVLHQESAKERLLKNAAIPRPGTPEAFGTFVAQEMAKWGALIKDKHIQLS